MLELLEFLEEVPVPAAQAEEPALGCQGHLKPSAILKAQTLDSPAGTAIPVCTGFFLVHVSGTLFGETLLQYL